MDSDNYPITLCLLSSQEPPKAYNVLRTFHSPSEYISPAGVRFCFVVPAQLYQSATRLEQNTAKGWMMNIPAVGLIGPPTIILAMNYWPLVIGYGLEYAVCRYPCLSPLTFRLIVSCLIASSPLISNLIPCLRQCFDADATGRCRSSTE